MPRTQKTIKTSPPKPLTHVPAWVHEWRQNKAKELKAARLTGEGLQQYQGKRTAGMITGYSPVVSQHHVEAKKPRSQAQKAASKRIMVACAKLEKAEIENTKKFVDQHCRTRNNSL
jgi:hypothetical protein